MEEKNFRIEYFEVNGSSVVKFHSFFGVGRACDYAIEAVMASREYCGVVVSLSWGDFYMPIMKFDITGLEK